MEQEHLSEKDWTICLEKHNSIHKAVSHASKGRREEWAVNEIPNWSPIAITRPTRPPRLEGHNEVLAEIYFGRPNQIYFSYKVSLPMPTCPVTLR